MIDRELVERAVVAEQAMREVAQRALALWQRRAELAVEHKGLQDVVSQADRELEALLRERLSRSFPDDAFFGEEFGGAPAASLWLIDPIDGTANFLRGIPYWSCTVAWLREGVAVLALTVDPVHEELFIARLGQGTHCNGRRVRVSAVTRPQEACIGLSYSFKTPAADYVESIRRLVAAGFDHRRLGSVALSLAHVACGRLDATFTLRTNAWDVIAGLLLVHEAGGYATDWKVGGELAESRPAAAAAPGIAALITRLTGIPMAAPTAASQA